MLLRNTLVAGVLLLVGVTAALTSALLFPEWLDHTREFLHLESAKKEEKKDDKKKADDDDDVEITLSEQAKQNLKLILLPLRPQPEFVCTMSVPGVVVERPGNCERLVSAPLAGVVKQIHAMPHDRIAPGKPLFTMQIISETLQAAQANYYKNVREMELVNAWLKQLEEPYKNGAIPQAKMIELEQQVQRLATGLDALQHELKMRGLTTTQIEKAGRGEFLTDITILAPEPTPNHLADHVLAANGPDNAKHQHTENFYYEMEELKTLVGDYVQAGQAMCRLADHKMLFIEGRVFTAEMMLAQKTAKEGLMVQAEFPGEGPQMVDNLQMRFFSNKVDPDTQTLTFYVLLANGFEELSQGGKTYRLWQYRPGQRVQVHMPVDKLKNVFVLPAAAVVREGPEAFIWRRKVKKVPTTEIKDGVKKEIIKDVEVFRRYSVNVLYEDTRQVVLAYDKRIDNREIARNGAVQLNWVLKAQRAEGEPDGH